MRRPVGQLAKSLSRNRVYVVRTGLAKGFLRKGGIGWLPPIVRRETAEHRFLRSLRLEARVVYDIGAFEGMLTLFFWRATGAGGAVVSFEPNPQSRARLLENLALNGIAGVRVEPIALGDHDGTVEIRFDPNDAGRSSLSTYASDDDRALEAAQVPIRRLADYRREHDLPPPDLLKIDVESHEHEVVAGALELLREHRPSLFIELHGDDEQTRRAIHAPMVEMIVDEGYSVLHVESGSELGRNPAEFPTGHLYCSPGDGADRVAG